MKNVEHLSFGLALPLLVCAFTVSRVFEVEWKARFRLAPDWPHTTKKLPIKRKNAPRQLTVAGSSGNRRRGSFGGSHDGDEGPAAEFLLGGSSQWKNDEFRMHRHSLLPLPVVSERIKK